jgi:carbon storage regulator
MLVLTRRIGESIIINDNIKITVNKIIGGQAVLGIFAPAEIPIHRKEIHDRIVAGQPKPDKENIGNK